MVVIFGVKTEDIEQAREWVETATGLEAEGRESSERGGDYYLFAASEDEEIYLVSNVDIYDGEPIYTESDEWLVAVSLEGTTKKSPVFRGLEAATEHFVKLKEKTYEE
jgi:hypothetical protein